VTGNGGPVITALARDAAAPASGSVKPTGAQLLAAFPPRPLVSSWPATEADRSAVLARVLGDAGLGSVLGVGSWKLGVDDAIGSNVPSSVWIENGSYLKLRNLTIGYTLPDPLLRKFYIKHLRIYASSQNLFTITKYSGLDPEIGIQNGNPTQNGVDNGTYPLSRAFTVGLNVTF